MKNLQKIGGLAALLEAAIYLFGFGLFLTRLDSSDYIGAARKVAFLAENHATIYLANSVIYVAFGVVLVVLVLALYQRLRDNSSALAQVATAFGLIWAGLVLASGMIGNAGLGTVVDLNGKDPAQAVAVWLAISSVQEGLGGGNEIVGGLWVLLITAAAWRAGGLPKPVNYLGAVVGLAGVLTAFPALQMLKDVFGITQIVWFAWVGITMLRSSSTGRSSVAAGAS